VRTLFDGDLHVSYGQMYVEDPTRPLDDLDLRRSFAGQVNGLCGVGIAGRLWLVTGLHTGVVRCTVERHDDEPAVPSSGWNEVVEASFVPAGLPMWLIGCMGEEGVVLPLAPGVPHRVRYCAAGFDAGKAADVRSADEPVVDRYLIQFWPAPVAPDAVLRQTGEESAYWHEHARGIDPASLQAEVHAPDPVEENLRWSGRIPPPHVREIAEAALLGRQDRALLDALVETDPQLQRAVARDAAHRACAAAGLGDVDWAALGCGEPVDDVAALWRALDEEAPVSAVPAGLTRRPTDDGIRPHLAAFALHSAADPDPLRAAVTALVLAARVVGEPVLEAARGIVAR
jgi:hypothetical protein